MSDIYKKVEELSKTYSTIDEPEFVRTGSIVLDALLGGGVPRGAFILWSSGSGIGKSTATLHICRSYCAQGLKVLYLDYEGGVNENQLHGIGLMEHKYDKDKNPSGGFFIFRVHTFMDGEEIVKCMLDEVDLVVFDSVTAMLPGKMDEGSVEDYNIGVQARLMGNMLRKYKAKTIKSGASWIMINQTRMKISFMAHAGGEEEAGGQALKFYSDYRIMMKEAKDGKLEKEEETAKGVVKVPYGSINEIWCTKSRFVRPFIPMNLTIVYGRGVSNIHAYKDFLEYKGVIRKPSKKATKYEVEIEPGNVVKLYDKEIVEYMKKNKERVKELVAEFGGYRLLMEKEPDEMGQGTIDGMTEGEEVLVVDERDIVCEDIEIEG